MYLSLVLLVLHLTILVHGMFKTVLSVLSISDIGSTPLFIMQNLLCLQKQLDAWPSFKVLVLIFGLTGTALVLYFVDI